VGGGRSLAWEEGDRGRSEVGGGRPRKAWSGRRRPRLNLKLDPPDLGSPPSRVGEKGEAPRTTHAPPTRDLGSSAPAPGGEEGEGGGDREAPRTAMYSAKAGHGSNATGRRARLESTTSPPPSPTLASATADPSSPAPPGSRLAVVEGWGEASSAG
jgi:hypothetical protein